MEQNKKEVIEILTLMFKRLKLYSEKKEHYKNADSITDKSLQLVYGNLVDEYEFLIKNITKLFKGSSYIGFKNGSVIIGEKLSEKKEAFGISTDFLFNELGEKIYTNKELFSLLDKQYPIPPNELMNLVDNVNKFCITYKEFNALILASATIQNALAKKHSVDDEFWKFANNHS